MATYKSPAHGSVLDTVALVAKWPVLLDATADDNEPIGGFALQQINKVSFVDGSCQSLVDLLCNSLTNPSYQVKLKSLQLMKYMTQHGHSDFRSFLRRRSAVITEATKFGGTPHPLLGMAPYTAVRDQATELSQLLFDEVDGDQQTHHNEQKTLTGMGNSGFGAQGFGNSVPTSTSLTQSIVSGLMDLSRQIVESGDADVKPVVPSSSVFRHYSPVDVRSVDTVQPITAKTQHVKKKRGHQRGRAGGGWEEEEEEALTPDVVTSLNDRLDVTDDWSSEMSLIEEVVLSSDEQFPSRKELKLFTDKCAELNTEKIMGLVNENLASKKRAVITRSLVLLEVSLHSDLCRPEVITALCFDRLVILTEQTENTTQQQKARKILRILHKLCPDDVCFSRLPPSGPAPLPPPPSVPLSASDTPTSPRTIPHNSAFDFLHT